MSVKEHGHDVTGRQARGSQYESSPGWIYPVANRPEGAAGAGRAVPSVSDDHEAELVRRPRRYLARRAARLSLVAVNGSL